MYAKETGTIYCPLLAEFGDVVSVSDKSCSVVQTSASVQG